jgi:hypothetical protein
MQGGRFSIAGIVPMTIKRTIGLVRQPKGNCRAELTRFSGKSYLLNFTAQYDSMHSWG